MRRLIFILLAMIGVSQAQTIQYIGAPTTTVISRGNFRTDSIFYLPKRSKAPTDTAALRYQISDSSLYAWTGSQWRKVGADADTLIYSTRAWRQKGLDSLAALEVSGSGTTNYVAKFTASGTIGNSGLYDSLGFFGIGTTSPKERVHIFRASDSDVSIQVQNISSRNYVITRRGGNLDLITSSGNILFSTNEVEKARITTAGNFGIMNQSPAYTLDVTGTLRSTGNTYLSTSSNETYVNTTTDAGDYKLQVSGNIYNTGSAVLNSVTIANNTPYITGSNISTASSLAIGSTAGFLSLNAANSIIQFNTNSAERGRINSAGEWIIDASGTDAGDYKLQVVGNIYNTGSITTGAPSGGSIKPWKIGEAATVSPTSPNRTIRVEIDGTVYYLHAKTTND